MNAPSNLRGDRCRVNGVDGASGRRDVQSMAHKKLDLHTASKPVPRPLQRVLDLVREVLERADGDRLLGRVPRGPVVFGETRHNDLSVALRS